MIIERATLLECRGQHAWVEAWPRSACTACDRGAGCGAGVLGRVFGRRRVRLRVRNPVRARAGDAVLVGIDEGALLLGSAAVYLLPVVSLVAAAAAGREMAGAHGELGALAGAGVGLIASLAWVRRYGIRAAARGRLLPVVLRRIESGSD